MHPIRIPSAAVQHTRTYTNIYAYTGVRVVTVGVRLTRETQVLMQDLASSPYQLYAHPVHVCVCVCVCLYLPECVRLCVYACMCVCVCVCVDARFGFVPLSTICTLVFVCMCV
jgi:hypothetical protein